MKAHLLFADRDTGLSVTFTPRAGFSVSGPALPQGAGDLVADLEIETMLGAMANGDELLFEIANYTLLSSLADPSEVAYRQEILKDCLAYPAVAREIYAITLAAIVREQGIYRPYGEHPSGVLRRSVEVLGIFVDLLKRLRQIADLNAGTMKSKGMRALFSMLSEDLTDDYFNAIDEHLERLKFKGGVEVSARLGKGNRGTGYVLRRPVRNAKRSWRERIGLSPQSTYSFQLAPRDEAGSRFLSELNDRGQDLAANSLAQSTDHILGFFRMLCIEIGFYASCLNLYDHLTAKGEPTCMPRPHPSTQATLGFRGIYDVCLALRSEHRLVGNDANADAKTLVMITGANSGGKSTLLRAIGLAQLMMQCGMFVGAEAFSASVAAGVFTHFVRQEDETMASGKLDEDLARMSLLADSIGHHSMVLFNESFGATNEREGSEIACQIVEALIESGVKVLFVTHQFTLASTLYSRRLEQALFLRAERAKGGHRSFKLAEGGPLPTSFGEDLYHRIGGFNSVCSATRPVVDA